MSILVCNACSREVKIEQKVVQVYILKEAPEGSGLEGKLDYAEHPFNHANCYEADGPRYDADGLIVLPRLKGYIKGSDNDHLRQQEKTKKCPECYQGKHTNCNGFADLTDDNRPITCSCWLADHPESRRSLFDNLTNE